MSEWGMQMGGNGSSGKYNRIIYAEGLIENAPTLSLGGQQRLPKEVIARLRSEEMAGMCEAQKLWQREQKRQHLRGLRGHREQEISKKRHMAGAQSGTGSQRS